MNEKSSKKVSAILQNGGLGAILSTVKIIDEISSRVIPLLDDQIRFSCQVATVKDKTLVLLTASSSTATMVHLRTKDLLQKFKQDPLLQGIDQIQCKVRPAVARLKNTLEKIRSITAPSQEAIETMEDLAESITDPDLKRSVQQIVTTWRGNDKP